MDFSSDYMEAVKEMNYTCGFKAVNPTHCWIGGECVTCNITKVVIPVHQIRESLDKWGKE